MSNPKLAPTEQEAVRRCVARHSGEWSSADEARLAEWLAASEANRQAYERVSRTWLVAGAVPTASTLVHRPAFAKARAAWAAVATVLLGTLIVWQADRWWNGVPQTTSSGTGQFATMALADGSEVQLDADSKVVVRVGLRRRSAEVLRGAALFTIAHDDARPFEVTAGQGRIVDLGTRFDVDFRGSSVRVQVFDGRIALHTARGEVEIPAGQGAGYDAVGALSPVTAVATTAPLWREGRLAFGDESLAEALQRLARYHPVRFEFADPTLAELRVSGTFRAGDLDGFLRTLEAGFPVHLKRGTDGLIVVSRAPSRK
ncbi:MAG TPA: FecR domain-containing protein [Rhodocyclaceae bacterium]|nr:FecR domain-containing protein [Rhodocyclaceae bacterium]